MGGDGFLLIDILHRLVLVIVDSVVIYVTAAESGRAGGRLATNMF